MGFVILEATVNISLRLQIPSVLAWRGERSIVCALNAARPAAMQSSPFTESTPYSLLHSGAGFIRRRCSSGDEVDEVTFFSTTIANTDSLDPHCVSVMTSW